MSKPRRLSVSLRYDAAGHVHRQSLSRLYFNDYASLPQVESVPIVKLESS